MAVYPAYPLHEFSDGTLGVSYQGRLLAQYGSAGELIAVLKPRPKRTPRSPVAKPALLTSAQARVLRLLSPYGRVPLEHTQERRGSNPTSKADILDCA